MTTILSLRLCLKAGGYAPIPVNGKRPPMKGWSELGGASADDIRAWDRAFPYAASTGILTGLVPALDIDVTNEEAAEAVETLTRERFEEIGHFLVRTGRAPKRAILFRTDTPFKKITAELIAPNGDSGQKLEFLCDGQQLVAFGLHKDTKQPYRWHGGEPGKIKREDLPYIHEQQARQLVRDAVDLLCRDFGYKRAVARPRNKANGAAGAADWAALVEAIKKGHGLHDSLRDLAAKLVASGMDTGAAINFLRGLMDQAEGEHDARWKARRDDIPRLVESAVEPKAAPPPVEPKPLAAVHVVFQHWLGEDYDLDTLDTMLAVGASEKLPGDPCWLMVVSGRGNAKTETVQASSGIGAHVISTITSDAALLSASPRKQRTKDATGGLLRKIGDWGVLCIKDFTSILSISRETRSTILAALREIHDGRWVRNVGVDGGHTLTWAGRLVVIAACTTALDQAHSVIATMGDRFVLVRSDSSKGRIKSGQRAMRNTGSEPQMREQLAQAVAGAIASVDADKLYQLDETDRDTILQAADLVTLARTGVELDYRGDVIDAHAPEMPTRFAKQLTQIMRGAVAIGMGQRQALRLAIRVARDSMPQLRLAVLKDVAANPDARVPEIRRRLQKPRATIDRTLQALHTLGLLVCEETEEERGDKTVSVWRYALADNVDLQVLDEPAERLL
jgi:hypothetical protein